MSERNLYDEEDKKRRRDRDSERDSRRDRGDRERDRDRDRRDKDRDRRDRDRDRRRDDERKRDRDDKKRDDESRDSKKKKEEKVEEPKEDDDSRKRRERLEAWKKNKESLLPPPLPTPSVKNEEASTEDATAPPSTEDSMDTTSPKMEEPEMTEEEMLKEESKRKRIALGFDELEDDEEESTTATTTTSTESAAQPAPVEEEEEVDPLDAFMADVQVKVKKDVAETEHKIKQLPTAHDVVKSMNISTKKEDDTKKKGKIIDSDDEEEAEEYNSDDDGPLVPKRLRKKELAQVDHTQIEYLPFKKNFYIEVPEIAKMTKEDVELWRTEHDNVRVRGKECPKPIKGFYQCGLSDRILKVMERLRYETPTPIQSQAIPAAMAGRDVIGIAKTGSGKTLSFLLPMLRHILDQPGLKNGDGPIGLIMAPTRELAMQIHAEFNKFCKPLGLTCLCVYGGSGVASQISELKRGAEIVVCTPGRMIDILCTNSGRVTNLRRVTFLVLDEADRMFDMGFEPQIMRIINNIRPDRQTVMFSATFPKHVEALAKKMLTRPVEIVVGGRSVVSSDIEQHVEVITEEDKFRRLVELIKEFSEKGLILVFVDRQDSCDKLYSDLMKNGTPCLSLHGGKDQQDRDFTIDDFKKKVANILVATSVAARGLDVKDLNLVVNYDVPNHMEDYVHRVGRTGRAGNKGTAYTFIAPDEEKYAPDILQAMEASGAQVPEGLKKLNDEYIAKKTAGQQVEVHGSGYGGKGFKFDEKEEAKKQEVRSQIKKAYFVEEEVEEEQTKEADSDTEDTGEGLGEKLVSAALQNGGEEEKRTIEVEPGVTVSLGADNVIQQAMYQVLGKMQMTPMANGSKGNMQVAQARVAEIAQAFAKAKSLASGEQCFDELEINDYPQQARWKVTHKDALHAITEFTGAAVTTRGSFVPPGKNPMPGERKLYLYIEGPDVTSVRQAKDEIKRILAEASVGAQPEKPVPGRYSVV